MNQDYTGWENEKRTRFLLIGFLLLVGLINFLPHLASAARGEGLFPFIYLDENYYAGGITKFCEEKGWGFREVYSYEDREKPFLYPRLPFVVLSIFSSLVGVGPTFVILHSVGPMLIFYLLLLIMKQLGFKRTLCFGGALIYVLQFHFVDTLNNYISYFGISGFGDFILPVRREYAMVFNVARIPDPALTRPMMLVAVLIMLKILSGKGSKSFLFLAVVSFSFCIFLRIYDWTILYPTAAFMAVHAFASGNRDASRRLGLVIVLTLPLLTYFVIGAQQRFHAFPETFYRNNAEDGRWLWPETIRDAVLVCLLVLAGLASWKSPARWLVISCLASCMIAMNGQLLMGYNIGGYHWKVFHMYPLILMIFGVYILYLFSRRKWEFFSWLLVFSVVLHSAICHFRLRRRPGTNLKYNEAAALAERIESDAVLCSDLAYPLKPSGAFYCFFPYPAYSAASSRDIMERWAIQRKLLGAVEVSEGDLMGNFYVQFTRYALLDEAGKKLLLTKSGMTDTNIKNMKELFRSLPEDKDELIDFARKKYKMDYVMIERKDMGNFSGMKRLEKVADSESLALFRVK